MKDALGWQGLLHWQWHSLVDMCTPRSARAAGELGRSLDHEGSGIYFYL